MDPQVGCFDDDPCEQRLHIALVLRNVPDLGGERREFPRAPCWNLYVRADECPFETPGFAQALPDFPRCQVVAKLRGIAQRQREALRRVPRLGDRPLLGLLDCGLLLRSSRSDLRFAENRVRALQAWPDCQIGDLAPSVDPLLGHGAQVMPLAQHVCEHGVDRLLPASCHSRPSRLTHLVRLPFNVVEGNRPSWMLH